jgi:DNA-binding response OmpR family regulator
MSGPSLAGLSVLVVEDAYYLADDAREALAAAGARVLGPFPDAEGALASLERERADCALVDVNLGRGPSFAPARALAERGVPVIFVTGYDEGVIPEALREHPCLQKPIDPGRLVGAVARLCGRA